MTEVCLPYTERLVLPDRAGGGDRLVQIAAPVLAPGVEPPANGWPVILLLDGAHLFGTAFEALRLRALTAGLASAVLVGLDYPDPFPQALRRRGYDYTPSAPADGGAADRPRPEGKFGGAEAFLEFILQDVWTAVAARFPVDAQARCLVGHSLGGLFALHALLSQPDAFRIVCALSPSLWWNDFELLHRSRSAGERLTQPGAKTAVLLTVGGREQDPPTFAPPGLTLEAFTERVRVWRMVDAVRELAEDLRGAPGLDVHACVFADEDHASVMPAALSRSLTVALG